MSERMDGWHAQMAGIDDGYHGKPRRFDEAEAAGHAGPYKDGYRRGWDERLREKMRETFQIVGEDRD